MEPPILIPSSLEIFNPPPLLESFTKTTDIFVLPQEGWKESKQITFTLPTYEHQLYESSGFEIFMTSRIVDGSDPNKPVDPETAKAAPCSAFGQLAYSPTIKIGDTYIYGDNSANFYADYLKLKLGLGSNAHQTWARETLGYIPDTVGKFDEVSIAPGEVAGEEDFQNQGFADRFKMFKNGRQIETISKLSWDLENVTKLLIPNIRMQIILNKTPDEILLQADPPTADVKFDIVSIKLKCRVRIPKPESMRELTRLLIAENRPTQYFMHRSAIKGPFQLSTSQSNFDFTVFHQVCPLLAFVFCVETTAAQGSLAKNALKLINPEYVRICLENEGEMFPSQAYVFNDKFTANPATAQAKEPYLELYKILQQQYGINCGLSYEEFIDGSTVIPFQLAQNPANLNYQQEKRTGDVRLKFTLQKPLRTETNLYVLGIFESELFTDYASGVLKTYT